METDEPSYDSASLLADVITSGLYGWSQNRARRTTFDELLSSGRFGLIRSAELRTQISAYYALDEGATRRIEERETSYPDLTYELAPRVDEFALDPTVEPSELDELAAVLRDLDLRRLFTAEMNLSRFVRNRHAALDAACEELIEALERYRDSS